MENECVFIGTKSRCSPGLQSEKEVPEVVAHLGWEGRG